MLKVVVVTALFVSSLLLVSLGWALAVGVVAALACWLNNKSARYVLGAVLLLAVIVVAVRQSYFTTFTSSRIKYLLKGATLTSPEARDAWATAQELEDVRKALEVSTLASGQLDDFYLKDDSGWRWAKLRFARADGKGLPIYQKEEMAMEQVITKDGKETKEEVTVPSWSIDPVWQIDPSRAVKIRKDEPLRAISPYGVIIFVVQPALTNNKSDGQAVEGIPGKDFVKGWIPAEWLSDQEVGDVDQAGAYGLKLQDPPAVMEVSRRQAGDASTERPRKPHPKAAKITIKAGDPDELSDWTISPIVPDSGEWYRIDGFSNPDEVVRVMVRQGSGPPVQLTNPRRDGVKWYAKWYHKGSHESDSEYWFILKSGEPIEVSVERM